MQFEPAVGLQRKSAVYGLNGLRPLGKLESPFKSSTAARSRSYGLFPWVALLRLRPKNMAQHIFQSENELQNIPEAAPSSPSFSSLSGSNRREAEILCSRTASMFSRMGLLHTGFLPSGGLPGEYDPVIIGLPERNVIFLASLALLSHRARAGHAGPKPTTDPLVHALLLRPNTEFFSLSQVRYHMRS